MYYVKIPLRHLVEPSELKVPQENQQAEWHRRVGSLMEDLRNGRIPAWATDYNDLNQVYLQKEDD